jgi:hypothetical protein
VGSDVQQAKVGHEVVNVGGFLAARSTFADGLGCLECVGRGPARGGRFGRIEHDGGRGFAASLCLLELLLEALDAGLEGGDIASLFASGELVVCAGALGGAIGLFAGGAGGQLAVALDLCGTAAGAGGDGSAHPQQRGIEDHGQVECWRGRFGVVGGLLL